mgnify:FL=1
MDHLLDGLDQAARRGAVHQGVRRAHEAQRHLAQPRQDRGIVIGLIERARFDALVEAVELYIELSLQLRKRMSCRSADRCIGQCASESVGCVV